MKRRYLFVLLICMFITGCTTKKPMDEKPVITELPNQEVEKIEDNPADETIKEETGFYGDYKITGCKGTAKVYAMSQEEIDDTIGNIVSYQEDTYAWNENIVETNYQEEMYPSNQMFDDFGIQPSELGIQEEEIKLVTATTEGYYIGNYFYILDDDNLLIYYEGVFFEAERIEKK